MKLIITQSNGWKRTIEHATRIELVPDDNSPDDAYLNVDNEVADDGGHVIVITEEA